MRLFLLRHAEAQPGYPDEARALTPAGVASLAPVAAWFRAHDAFGLTEAHHSTLRRARETAAVLNQHLARPLTLHETPGLAPEDTLHPWLQRLRQPSGDLLLIGHNPFLTGLAGLLLRLPEPFPFDLPKAGLAVLRHHQGSLLGRPSGVWELVAWMPSPADSLL